MRPKKGYLYGITIDSDGQHFAKDLPYSCRNCKQTPNSIIIGARNMNQESVPGGSSFGNKFSNFWFRVETGIKADTQSGYRLYPCSASKMRFYRKYEFEIEVLVRAAWKGISVESVPVTVYYAPGRADFSFQAFQRLFFRISVLNTVLVLITFFFIKPGILFAHCSILKKLAQLLNDHLFNSNHPGSKRYQ